MKYRERTPDLGLIMQLTKKFNPHVCFFFFVFLLFFFEFFLVGTRISKKKKKKKKQKGVRHLFSYPSTTSKFLPLYVALHLAGPKQQQHTVLGIPRCWRIALTTSTGREALACAMGLIMPPPLLGLGKKKKRGEKKKGAEKNWGKTKKGERRQRKRNERRKNNEEE